MEILLITGGCGTGKSETIYDTVDWLRTHKEYIIEETFHNIPFHRPKTSGMLDCEVLLKGSNGKTILVHSATDNEICIDKLVENITYLSVKGETIDVLIVSCRRFDDPMRAVLCTAMGWSLTPAGYPILDGSGKPVLEIPLLRIRYDSFAPVNGWYKDRTYHIVHHILERDPYNL